MSDFDPNASDAQARLDEELVDDELEKLRDYLKSGADVQQPTLVNTYAIAADEVAVPLDIPTVLTVTETVETILNKKKAAENRFFIAVGCRTAGKPFLIQFSVASIDDFENILPYKDVRYIGGVSLFDGDHVDDKRCVDGPLGNFTLDATAALDRLFDLTPNAQPSLQVLVSIPDYEEDTSVTFSMSKVAIVEVAF